MIDRAISNVLLNAMRYTPAGEEITVEIQPSAGRVIITIQNGGATIDWQYINKIFDRFYRADPERREGGSNNTGVSLAITRSAVEANKGRVWRTSSKGLTSFHFTFPAAQKAWRYAAKKPTD